MLESHGKIMSSELLFKEGSELELERESGSRFHSLGSEACNALEPLTVLHQASPKSFIAAASIHKIHAFLMKT